MEHWPAWALDRYRPRHRHPRRVRAWHRLLAFAVTRRGRVSRGQTRLGQPGIETFCLALEGGGRFWLADVIASINSSASAAVFGTDLARRGLRVHLGQGIYKLTQAHSHPLIPIPHPWLQPLNRRLDSSQLATSAPLSTAASSISSLSNASIANRSSVASITSPLPTSATSMTNTSTIVWHRLVSTSLRQSSRPLR